MNGAPWPSLAELRELVLRFEESDWQELVLSVGDVHVELRRDAAPADAAAAAAPPPAEMTPEARAAARAVDPAPALTPTSARSPRSALNPHSPASADGADHVDVVEVVSPSVGVFWRSPSPGAPPFAAGGDAVGADDTVCIVEVMKLMNHVPAGVEGIIRQVLVDNGATVERGQPLFLIEPSSARR